MTPAQQAELRAVRLAKFDAAQDADDEEMVVVGCPECSATQKDYDGFGLLNCENCGYCTHASINGDVCGLCHKRLAPAPAGGAP